ncbi:MULTISPECIES: sulfite reductase flavoprotein subunit alpha [unclassified Acidovorax]|uniref:sulfite reductase subunit alpha n=1 Tax=unclassified Acidovorax TaxID=2684926 RepID=UPI0028830C1F|nr:MULTISPECIES: sulfite reductase flavoprotein subunit alpha [unclassified Acidovorax]
MTAVWGLSIPASRLFAALLTVALYALMCAAIAWRERRRAQHVRSEAASLAAARDGAVPLLVAYASQTGQAEEIARETARLLHAAGEPVQLCELDSVDAARLAATQRALFIVSTYGEGDAPDNAGGFQGRLMGAAAPLQPPHLSHLQYGVLALGDRQYAHFCGFGRQLDEWLRAQGAMALFERVEMDNGSATALQAWQHQLAQVAALDEPPAWQSPVFEAWTLVARRHLNPGSQGAPVFHLEFALPAAAQAAAWQSGDLVQVCVPADAQHPRDYSIASVPADGRVHLTVRQSVRGDGTPGIASSWLCEGLPLGDSVEMRLRAHSNFRLEGNAAQPLILIGNGTGIAGLRSHLRARSAAGQGAPNWLVFGERQSACDFLYRAEIDAWRADGTLRRLDLAFSRDGAERVYVQDVLAKAADDVRTWVEQGAAIYVCGSLQGMAQGVHAALQGALGDARMDELVRSGRYRRDVY